MRTERGASGLFIAVILILVAAVALAILALTGGSANIERGTQVADRFKVLEAALQQYVTANGRLPCPANPALDTGDADPVAASAVCNSAQGTVPWKAIGVRREDAIDSWGGKIAYRVFAGNTGLTQATGASMVNCDTVEPGPAGVDASGLCRATQNTTEAEFLAGKGLVVAAFGTALADVAYVLISHGPTGLGAFTTAGTQKMLPASAGELANTSAAGPFVAQAASAQGVAPGDAAHYDDVLAYARIGDLIRRAGMGGRNWPDAAGGPVGITFDAPTVSAAAGTPVSPGGVGQNTLNFTGAQVSGRGTGASLTEIAFDSLGGYGGLGVATGGSNLIQSSADEFLRISFTETGFTKLGITLNDFGVYGFLLFELVEFRFYLDDTAVGSTVTGVSCNFDGALASFSVDVATAFNRVDIVPIPAFNFFGAPGITAFLVSEVKACPATEATCRTVLDDPANPFNTRCT